MRDDLDFAPLYRSSIGFDRVLNLLSQSQRLQAADTWPPYDIVKVGDDDYRIVMAVAGFAQEDLTITHERNVLVIKGARAEKDDMHYLHHGIAGRAFDRRFELADHVSVVGAGLANGLLTIDLKHEIPEEMKPRRIAINSQPAQAKAPLQIDADKQVA